MSWGALPLGHAHPEVVQAIQEQAACGTHFGTPTRWDIQLVECLLRHVPHSSQSHWVARFVNSGTESVMTALRLARSITDRSHIIKVEGAYHGHVDSLLVKAGSGLSTQNLSGLRGVPQEMASTTLVVPFGDIPALKQALHANKGRVAAMIIEPVMANHGLFTHTPEYMQESAALLREEGALWIWDEVITGFRRVVSDKNSRPDIITYGKVLGGGMPVGAIAGPFSHLQHLAPVGEVYQAGTLSGNPLVMRAGCATIEAMEKYGFWSHIEKIGQYMEELWAELCPTYTLHRRGSLFWFEFGPPGGAPHAIAAKHVNIYKALYHKVLSQGVYLPPSAFEVGFLSLSHTKEHIKAFLLALNTSLKDI